jgi:D-inositol-3-phosphate glycosyltransferase
VPLRCLDARPRHAAEWQLLNQVGHPCLEQSQMGTLQAIETKPLLKIFYAKEPSKNLVHLQSVSQCFGISSELVDVCGCGGLANAMEEFLATGYSGAALDLASLGELSNTSELEKVAKVIGDRAISLLLLATCTDEDSSKMLGALTQGAVSSVKAAAEATRVNFPREGRAWSQELFAQSYPRKKSAALILSTSSPGCAQPIMGLDGAPSFVYVSVVQARLFVWSTPQVMDVFRPLNAELEFELATDEYIPAIIFLRAAFEDCCWHNPSTGAGLVIDDPLLKKKYGFIKFDELLASARENGFFVTLAFIPWNGWRSRKKQVQLFLDHRDCFSVCAHGCDHTHNEYGSENYDVLLAKNTMAAERMEKQEQSTGLSYEALMVCPQEQYSLEAMQAFADSGQFLALVNTSCVPRNLSRPAVCAADLLTPAQDSFFGFPVFKRHYWKDMSPFAMGLFLGKPAILVEHHEFFGDACRGIEDFASQLAGINPDVKWKPISDIATTTHLRRRISKSECWVRFFTNKFTLQHTSQEPVTYRLRKRLPVKVAIERVLVNGEVKVFSRESDAVQLEIRAERPQTFEVQIETHEIKPGSVYSPGLKYQIGVALRRGLSEFRDNVLSKNRFGLKAVRYFKSRLTRQLKRRDAAVVSKDSHTRDQRAGCSLNGNAGPVALLTGGFDKPYVSGLAMSLAADKVCVDVVGGDDVDSPEMHATPNLKFLNLRGSKAEASLPSKIWRVLVYYMRLLRYAAVAEPKIFHILWNNKFDVFDRTLLMLYYKALGKKIVFTAHNVNAGKRDSNDSLLNRLTLRAQYGLADHIFVHTEKMKRELTQEFAAPEGGVSVIPFGINNSVPNTRLTASEAKQRLGIKDNAKTILFFGAIRPYKGLEFLVEAFLQLAAECPQYQLLIAGEPRGGSEAYWSEISKRIEGDIHRGQVIQKLQYIPDEETEVYFKAADVLALPYTHVFQSGVLFLAYNFGLPVLATDVGSIKEEVLEGKTGFLCKPSDPADLARAIEKYFESDVFRALDRHRLEIRDWASARNSWAAVSETTCRVYSELLSR